MVSSRLDTVARILANRKMIIVSLIVLILLVPIASAYAENFIVTTNKNIYSVDEKVIVVGVIPSDSPSGYAVVIQVTGPDGKSCAVQNILPAADSSFVSRPVKIDCGLGQYSISASYTDLTSTSIFTVSSSQTGAGSRLELRMIKNVVMQAQEAVNARVQELINANYVLPADVVDRYSKGISETSLAAQAVDFGNAAEAKKQAILAIRDFRAVLDALSSDRLMLFEQNAEQQAGTNSSAANITETYNRLQEFYYRLEDLASKNQVEKGREFAIAASLLASSRQMIDDGNLQGAETRLAQVNSLLEGIRAELFSDTGAQDKKAVASTANSTDSSDEANRLANVADKFEQRAVTLLNETSSNPEATAKVQEALSLIARARSSIDQQDYDSARESLSAAYKALNEAKDLVDGDHGDGSNSSSSSSGANESEKNKSSGNSTGDKN